MGGISGEREISILTGNAVLEACNKIGYDTTQIILGENINGIIEELQSMDKIFISLHGGIGENGVLQGFFDDLKIPYTGSGVLASSLAMNKILAKKIFTESGINVAKDQLADINDVIEKDPMSRPYVLKPIDGGSSIDIEIIDKNFDTKILTAKKNKTNYFVEQFIEGKELSVAIIDNEILGIIEIKYVENFYNYNAKYKASETKYVLPKNISSIAREKLNKYALSAHKSLGCKGLTRADFILPITHPDDPVLLEINTLPGLTTHSLVPKIANNCGISYDNLIAKIIHGAIN